MAQPAIRGTRAPLRLNRLGVRPGQVVAGQLAIALPIGAAAAGPGWLVLAGPLALLLLVVALGRWRHRWAYQWVGQAARYATRRRSLPAGGTAATLLALLRPGAAIDVIEVDGTPVGVIEDAYGLTAVLELGDTTGLLAEERSAVPSPAALLPPRSPDQPAVRVQLLVAGVGAPAVRADATTAATSYRQLTEGRVLAQQRVLLAVHVRRMGGFAAPELRRGLASAVRRVRRRMDRLGLACRPLAGDSVLRVVGDLAHFDGARPVEESWSGIDAGDLRQVAFRLTRWPDPSGDLARTLVPRLLTMPAAGTTVSLSVERTPASDRHPDQADQVQAERSGAEQVRAELVVRLAATSQSGLTVAIDALRALLGAAQAAACRLDGAHLDGLAATLPLGGSAAGAGAPLAGLVAGHDGLDRLDGLDVGGPAPLAAIELPVGGAGLMLGVNRHGTAVTVRLFRPEPTRAVLIGGLRCAQLIVLRALAIGARVVVQSGRPYAWEPFLRGANGPGDAVRLVPPGRQVESPPATAVAPQLVVVDVGAVGATGLGVLESAWLATLVVRDELTGADLDLLARADLALLQPLTAAEAALAASALGLGDSASWLTRIRGDMVGVVVGRRTMRWALLSGTPIEAQLIGPVSR